MNQDLKKARKAGTGVNRLCTMIARENAALTVDRELSDTTDYTGFSLDTLRTLRNIARTGTKRDRIDAAINAMGAK